MADVSLIPEAYRKQIERVLAMRGLPATDENIIKVATAKPKKDKEQSDIEKLAFALGTPLLSSLGAGAGDWLKDATFGSGASGATSNQIPSKVSTDLPIPKVLPQGQATTSGLPTPQVLGAGQVAPTGGILSTALPVAGAIAGIYNTQQAWEDAKGESLGDAIKEAITKPRFWLSPISGLGTLAGSLFG